MIEDVHTENIRDSDEIDRVAGAAHGTQHQRFLCSRELRTVVAAASASEAPAVMSKRFLRLVPRGYIIHGRNTPRVCGPHYERL